ncbi:MAG: V-type ATP synthase subunit D [Candidatus Kariarchaeaceae archaeon]
MAQVKPTRMELLKTKKRIKLAVKGHKLLKQKRDVLVMEFFGILKEIKEIRIKMGVKLGKAKKSLFNAIALDGALDIERLSLGLAQEVKIDFVSEKLMGVEIPKLQDMQISYEWPGYFDQSVELDNAIVKYRNLFPDLVKLAEKQLVMTKLAEEIKKTKRRVNSLEYLTIPRLEGIARFIAFRLEELERENFARLKVIKNVQEKKAEA